MIAPSTEQIDKPARHTVSVPDEEEKEIFLDVDADSAGSVVQGLPAGKTVTVAVEGAYSDQMMESLIAGLRKSAAKIRLDLSGLQGLRFLTMEFAADNSRAYPSFFYDIESGKQFYFKESLYSLHSISLPQSLEGICNRCFEECRKLSEVVLPDTLKYIGDRAFYGCPLQKLELSARPPCNGHDIFSERNDWPPEMKERFEELGYKMKER